MPERSVEELVSRVAKESGKSEVEVRKMMEEKKRATHGLLTDYGAIYAVAKELGIDLHFKPSLTRISDLSPGRSVSLAGRVKAVFAPRTFEKEGRKGRIGSLIVADRSGEVRLVLWDSQVELLNHIRRGDVLLVKNASCKEGRRGFEVHASPATSISINPKLELDLPEPKLFKISEIKELPELESVDFICKVLSYFPPVRFEREGKQGLRSFFIAGDETGRIRVVLWGEAAERFKPKPGDIVRVENAYTKLNRNGELEVHLSTSGRILEEAGVELELPLPSAELKVSEITPELTSFSIVGRVLQVFKPRPYANGVFASLIVADETGSIRAVLWDEKAELVNQLKGGSAIRIRNAYSRANLKDEPEVHVGKYGEIELASDVEVPSLEEIERRLLVKKPIVDLRANERFVKISGEVVGVDETRRLIYMTCSKCGRRIQNLGFGWFCDRCNEDVEPVPNLFLSFRLADETGSIRVVSFGEVAESIVGIDVEDVMNLIGETQDESTPLKVAEEKLKGLRLSLIGRTRYSEISDQLEFIAERVA